MESHDPEELAQQASQQQENISELAVDFIKWFLDEDNIGELYPRVEVREELADKFNTTPEKADNTISSLVGDVVDPVQQIDLEDGKFVGVIDYIVFENEGAYGYTHFSDRFGKRKRVVCAKCVEKQDADENVVHATQGEGSVPEDADWSQLLDKVTSHYASSHTSAPKNIEPGAILLDGTTISGNTTFHAGNVVGGDGVSVSNTTITSSARDVARNAQGNVRFQTINSASTAGTQLTLNVSTTAFVNFEKISVDASDISGNAVLKRNGASIASISSGTAPFQTTNTVESANITWTASASIGDIYTANTDINTTQDFFGNSASNSIQESAQVYGTGSFISISTIDEVYIEYATGYVSVDGSSISKASPGGQFNLPVTATGTFTDPYVTARLHATTQDAMILSIDSSAINLLETGTGELTITVSRDNLVSVQ